MDMTALAMECSISGWMEATAMAIWFFTLAVVHFSTTPFLQPHTSNGTSATPSKEDLKEFQHTCAVQYVLLKWKKTWPQ